MSASAAGCFHCGADLPARPVRALVSGADHEVCCHGCKAVAEFIASSGLGAYYERRSASALTADMPDVQDRWAAYERDELVARLTRAEPGGRRSMSVVLEGMRCAACAWLADRALRACDGVDAVDVNAATGRARLTWDPRRVHPAALLRALDSVGLRPHPVAGADAELLAVHERRAALKRLAVAGIGMMQVMMFAAPLYLASGGLDSDLEQYFRLVSLLTAVPVAIYSGWPFYRGAVHALRAGGVSMDVPVSVGILLAFVASVWNALRGRGDVYFDSVTMFVFFLSLARYVEMVARHRAGSLVDALARLTPGTARRMRGGNVEDVPATELGAGDLILVRRGEFLAADGIIVEGDGRLDESMLSGESAAVARPAGSRVAAGSQNVGEPLRIRITAVGDGTVLSGIVALLQRAQAERPQLARVADRAAAWFLGRILIGAAIVFAVWWLVDPSRAFAATLAVLVATCPCALSLATPAALAAASAALARRGVLVAHGDALEALADADTVLWDKTGTLTHGSPRIEAVVTAPAVSRAVALEVAAALERASEHPLARAFAVGEMPGDAAIDVRIAPGQGVEGVVDGRRYRIGAQEYALANADADVLPPGVAADWIHLGDASSWMAAFRVGDVLRNDAGECIAELRARGLASEIVSGDAPATVAAIATSVGIERSAARLTPQGKLQRLDELQAAGARVVAIGDGINDAPLLGRADVSIAMGRGSALAQSGADLILVRDSLAALPCAVDLARKTRRVMRQNLRWSIGYNLAILPLAAAGWVPPWLAAVGMSLSSIFVVLNAMRLSAPKQLGGREARGRTAVESG